VINALAAEISCDHVREHLLPGAAGAPARKAAANELSLVIRQFIR
jgi:hypothetical protein